MTDTQPWKPDQLEAARHLLFHYGKPGGLQPGRFHTQLIKTLEAADQRKAADQRNLSKLLRAFPEYQLPLLIVTTRGAAHLAHRISIITATTPNQ